MLDTYSNPMPVTDLLISVQSDSTGLHCKKDKLIDVSGVELA